MGASAAAAKPCISTFAGAYVSVSWGQLSRMGGCRLHGAADIPPTVAQLRAETGTATAVRIRDVTLIWHGPVQTPALCGSVPAIQPYRSVPRAMRHGAAPT